MEKVLPHAPLSTIVFALRDSRFFSLLVASALGCSAVAPSGDPTAAGGSHAAVGGVGGTTSSAAGGTMAGTNAAGSAGTNASAGISGGSGVSGGGQAGATDAGGSGPMMMGSSGEAGEASIDPALLPPVTIHLAGDSTVMTYEADSLQEGWGQELAGYFTAKVTIDNQAIGGASVRTFHDGSRWKNIMSALEQGDFVMAAFGANDSGTVAGRHVDPADYEIIYGQMADEVSAKGAKFVIVTPAALQEWTNGVEGNKRLGPYVAALASLAQKESLPLVDLNARSVEYLNVIGQQTAQELYIGGDKAHFTKKGAVQMAEFIAQELRRIDHPLGDYLR